MPLKTESKYPNRRAYVLKLHADARPDALAGRVENLVSGTQTEFATAHDLLACLARDLEAEADAPSMPMAEADGDRTPTQR